MKKQLTLLLLTFLASLILGCGDDSSFSPGGGISSSNIISKVKFTIASDNLNPEFIKVTYLPGTPPTTIDTIDSFTVGGALVISAFGADRFGAKTSGNNITFVSYRWQLLLHTNIARRSSTHIYCIHCWYNH